MNQKSRHAAGVLTALLMWDYIQIVFAATCLSNIRLPWSELLVFCRDDVELIPEGFPGVYSILAFTPRRPRLVVVYIGQSTDVRRRLLEHLRGSALPGTLGRSLSTYATVAPVDDPEARVLAERGLIGLLRPVGNDLLPAAGPPIAVNPPPTSLL